jgi:ABC-2 type transport system permease protein
MRLAKSIRYGAALLSTNLKAAVALPGAFWLQACFMAINNIIYAVVWWVFFERFKDINGWRAGDTYLLYGLVALAFGAAVVFAGGSRELSRVISDGALDTYLTQPKSPLLQVILSKTHAAGWGDMFSGVLLLIYSQRVSVYDIPLISFTVVCGALLFTAAAVSVHSIAFWAGPIDSLARQFTEFLITFSIYPERIFGGWIRVLLFTAVPAGFIGFLPVKLLSEFSWVGVVTLGAATAAYILIALAVFSFGLRRYESGNQIVTGSIG